MACPPQLCLALALVYDEVHALERHLKDIDRQLARVAAAVPSHTSTRGHNKAAIAVANKLARVVWAVWHGERDFSGGPQVPVAA